MVETKRICENCKLFDIFNGDPNVATDAETGEGVKAGVRNCHAKNVAWGDSPCVTNQFEEKEQKPVA